MSWAERAGQVGNRQRKKTGALLGIAEQMHSFVVDAANAGAKAGGLVPHANQIKIGLVHALRSIGMPASRPVTDLRRRAFHERCTSGRSTEFIYAWRHSLARPHALVQQRVRRHRPMNATALPRMRLLGSP